MKNISEILNHIVCIPEFNKINTFLEIKRFVNILPLKLKSGIKFVYIKNKTLNFVLTHQVFRSEFEHNKDNLKALVEMSNLKNINNFAFFVSNSIEKPVKNIENITQKYSEKSFAIFENRAKDENIFKKFEEIRNIIKDS